MKQEYAAIVHGALKEAGINFVAYLPDQIHDAQAIIEDPSHYRRSDQRGGSGFGTPAPGWAAPNPPCSLPIQVSVATWPLASLSVSGSLC
jgi:hypothetical protein